MSARLTRRQCSTVERGDNESKGGCERSHALSAEVTEQMRHSISLRNLAEHRRSLDANGEPSELAEDVRQPAACYSASMLFKPTQPSPVLTASTKQEPVAQPIDVSDFPHLPTGDVKPLPIPALHRSATEPSRSLASPTSSSFLSRLSFLSFGSSSQDLRTPQTDSDNAVAGPFSAPDSTQAEYQSHPLTRSMSEAVIAVPTTGEQERRRGGSCSRVRLRKAHSRGDHDSPSGRSQSCAHPLTHLELCGSECSTPPLSPRAVSTETQLTREAFSPDLRREGSHLSVRTCELSDVPDSPQASPTSLTSIGSYFFSGLTQALIGTPTAEASRAHSSGLFDMRAREQSLDTSNASSDVDAAASVSSAEACLSRPISPSCIECTLAEADNKLDVSGPSTSAAAAASADEKIAVEAQAIVASCFDTNLDSWPLAMEAVDDHLKQSWVDSCFLLEEDVAQVLQPHQPSSGASSDQACPRPQPAAVATAAGPGKVSALTAAVQEEVSAAVEGANTSSAIREQVPEKLLCQLVGLTGAAEEIQKGQAEAAQAACGPGSLLGCSVRKLGAFELVAVHSESKLGLKFMVEKQALRKNLFMYRTRARIGGASVEAMRTYMLTDQVVRSSSASMLEYVRLADASLAGTSEPASTDSGFMYSKIKFPMIGSRQYVAARRVWHREDALGFYVVSTSCSETGALAQAQQLVAAKGHKSNSWAKDFWAGYVVREYEEDGNKGVEVASVTFEDMGIPAWIANSASVPGFWAGAQGFTDGFRSFERVFAEASASGGDVLHAFQDVQEHAVHHDHSAPQGPLRRARKVAVGAVCMGAGLILRSKLG